MASLRLHKLKGKLASLFFLFFSLACIDQYDLFENSTPTLIVDGYISNLPGPHTIRINYSRKFNTPADFSVVNNLNVSVHDSEGNVEVLGLSDNGQYSTSEGFIAEEGKCYWIEIKMNDGTIYRSTDECMRPKVALSGGNFAIESVERISDEGILYNINEVVFSIDFSDPPDIRNFYRWRYQGTFQFMALEADNFTMDPVLNRSLGRGCVPDRAVRDCWVKDFDHEFLILDDDRYFDGRNMLNYEVYSEEIDNRFGIGYDANVQCHAITETAHKYWTEIQEQINNNGTIFEKANYQIRGNLYSISDPDELILGYFGVNNISEEHIFVHNYDVGKAFEFYCEPNPNTGCYPEPCIDCRKYRPSSSEFKPDFWED